MNPRLLITGHRGLLGSACVKVMREDYEVVTAENVDLRSRDSVYWLFNRLQPQYVIHCAAKVGGIKANRDNPVSFLEDNVAINGNVIAACHLFQVKKLVNIGTSCMFPKNATIPVKESSFQTGPLEPDVEAYAAAKILAYMACRAYRSEHACNFVTACPANLYGPNDSYGEEAHVIPALIRKATAAKKDKKRFEVWGDGSAVREFLHSEDAANAIKIILEKYDSPELISIGSGVGTSIKQLASTISYLAGAGEVHWVKSEPTGIQEKTFDVSKLKALGWSQTVDLQHGLSQVICDYQNNIDIRKR